MDEIPGIHGERMFFDKKTGGYRERIKQKNYTVKEIRHKIYDTLERGGYRGIELPAMLTIR